MPAADALLYYIRSLQPITAFALQRTSAHFFSSSSSSSSLPCLDVFSFAGNRYTIHPPSSLHPPIPVRPFRCCLQLTNPPLFTLASIYDPPDYSTSQAAWTPPQSWDSPQVHAISASNLTCIIRYIVEGDGQNHLSPHYERLAHQHSPDLIVSQVSRSVAFFYITSSHLLDHSAFFRPHS